VDIFTLDAWITLAVLAGLVALLASGAVRTEVVVLGGDADARARLEAVGFRREGTLEPLTLTVFSLPPGLGSADIEELFYATQTDLDPLRRTG